eukprot:1691678-Rhodomonas_salina.1
MCGTEIAYAATCDVTRKALPAICGTEIAYAATSDARRGASVAPPRAGQCQIGTAFCPNQDRFLLKSVPLTAQISTKDAPASLRRTR